MAETLKNLMAFERFTLVKTIANQIHRLKHMDERPHLEGASTWSEALSSWLAPRLDFNGLHVSVGDFVITTTDDIVETKVVGRQADDFFILGDKVDIISRFGNKVTARRVEKLALIWIERNTSVRNCLCWRSPSSGDVEVLVPSA